MFIKRKFRFTLLEVNSTFDEAIIKNVSLIFL
jgi:hypothetical protein